MNNLTPKILENLREKKGWTKSLVAKKLGIKTVSTYANWEYGLRTPDKEMLAKIADLYGVTTDYLITGENKQTTSEQIYDDPDFQLAMRSAQGFSEENKQKVLEFIGMLEEVEKARNASKKKDKK